MGTLEKKLIIYDNNCKVCSSLKDLVSKVTNLPAEKVRAFGDLEDRFVGQVDADQFRNGMALVDTTGKPTLYGAEGVAYIFSSQYRLVGFLLRFRPIFLLFSFLYKCLAYNRYIIATPRSKFRCDCYPDRVTAYRVAYILITLAIAVLLTALFGITLRGIAGVSAAEAAAQMLLVAGTGWVLQCALVIGFAREKALDYIGHLGSIMVVGLLILVPVMFSYLITGITSPAFAGVSVVISSMYMLHLHVHRARHIELSQLWTVSWFVFLQGGAAFWLWFFHSNELF